MEKEIDWEQVDKDSQIYLQKYSNFEKELKRIKKSNKSLEQMTQEVNDFCEKHNITRDNLQITNKNSKK